MTVQHNAGNRIRVLIADDHGLMRAGLRHVLLAEEDILVVGEAADGSQAITLSHELQPDVILLDISMPPPDGIEVARRLTADRLRAAILMLTMHEDPDLARAALEAGATGYIVKRAVESELTQAIRAVAGGDRYVHKDLARALEADTSSPQRAPGTPPTAAPPARADLSEAELALLRMLAEGRPMRDVAEGLGVSLEEADALRGGLAARLGLRTRVDIVRFAKEQGIQ